MSEEEKTTKKAPKEKSGGGLGKIIIPVLVLLLVGASFMSGSLFTQLKSLQKGKETAPTAETQEEPTQEQAQNQAGQLEEKVLGDQDRAEIEDSDIVRGSADAPITIVEFSEYQCPFCKRYVDSAYAQIWDEYGDQIRYIFRDYPLPFHQHAQITAEAARCSFEQGDYWGYHDLLFANRDKWETESDLTKLLNGYAAQLGLDTAQFSDCLSSGKYTQAVKDDFALGQKVGVGGTPSFFINGRMLVGAQPFEAFKAIIDEELGKS